MGLASSEWEVVDGFVTAERVLREAGDKVPPAGLSPASADQAMTCLIAIQKRAAGLLVLMAEQAAQTGSWRTRGARSPEEDLAKRTGTGIGKAKDTLRTSKRLRRQPKVEAALRDGTLSDQQASAVSDAADADPSAESRLVDKAGETDLRGLTDECRKVRAAADPDPDATNKRIHRERYFRHGHDAEGAFTGSFRITPQAGAELMAAFAPFREAAFRQARSENRREPFEAIDADALVAMATAAAGSSDAPTTGRKDVYVVADLEALRCGGSCEMEGAPVPASVVQDILDGDDAFLIGVLKHGVDVQKVVRWGRYVPAEVRDALLIRDGFRCSHPGCSRKARLQRDHLQPYAKDGPTSLANLQLLCVFHHRLKTAHDRLFDPDGPEPRPPNRKRSRRAHGKRRGGSSRGP
jgi:hypothetical protein